MENDDDFLNQKIIPAEENLGNSNNEHKQTVLTVHRVNGTNRRTCPRCATYTKWGNTRECVVK